MQDLEVVEVASLLHDIQDWKYSGSEVAGANAVQVSVHPLNSCTHETPLEAVLLQAYLQQAGYPGDKAAAVLAVVQGIGFKVLLHTRDILCLRLFSHCCIPSTLWLSPAW